MSQTTDVVPLPPPDEAEQKSIAAAKERQAKRTQAPRVREQVPVQQAFVAPHSDADGWYARLCDTFGTNSWEFTFNEVARTLLAVEAGATQANGMLAFIDGVKPENEVEAALAGQMFATHALAMTMMHRAAHATELRLSESAGNMAIKLLRTYTTQTEALAKLRRGGEQTVRVEHVHVYPGAQAVVGNVTNVPLEGGRLNENSGQPHAPDARALAFAPGSPVWGDNAPGIPVPVAGGKREEAVPNARRRKG